MFLLVPTRAYASPSGSRRRLSLVVGLVLVLVLAVVFLPRWGHEEARASPGITVFAYSGLDSLLENGLLKEFASRYEQQSGVRITIERRFGGSHELVQSLLQGADAQVAVLASEVDALALTPDLVRTEAWRTLPMHGVLARTPVVLLVRDGNPRRIVDFESLVSTDAILVRPMPRTSGLGSYALVAAYAEGLRRAGRPDAGIGLAARLAYSSLCPARSARAARRCFDRGIGDVCVAYEHDVIETRYRDAAPGTVVVPPYTVLCEPVVVVLRRNATPDQQAILDALLGFLWSPEALALLSEHGLHRPDADGAALGIPEATRLADLGGPEVVDREVLERLLEVGTAE